MLVTRIARGLALIVGAVLALCLVLLAVEAAAYDDGFYAAQYARLSTAQTIGVSQDDLMQVTRSVIDYLRGRANSMQLYVPVNGNLRPVFNERELSHMVDVRALFDLLRTVLHRGLQSALWLGVLACCLLPRRGRLTGMGFGLLYGPVCFLVLLAALSAYIASDFERAFVQFHHLFFTNDLWQLDPRTDILLMMVPQPFFEAIALRIALYALLFMGAVMAAGYALRRLGRPRPKQQRAKRASKETAQMPQAQTSPDDWKLVPSQEAGQESVPYHILRPDETRPGVEDILSRFERGVGLPSEAELTITLRATTPAPALGDQETPLAMEMLGWLDSALDAARHGRPAPSLPRRAGVPEAPPPALPALVAPAQPTTLAAQLFERLRHVCSENVEALHLIDLLMRAWPAPALEAGSAPAALPPAPGEGAAPAAEEHLPTPDEILRRLDALMSAMPRPVTL